MPKTALIVDDAPTMRQMVSFTLKNDGFTVLEAGDGLEAIEKMKAGARPDIVITDMNMPRMDGITLIKNLRLMPQCRFTPILMLTTESLDDKKLEGKSAGATGWIVKPFTPEHMLKVVKMVMP